MDFVFGTFATDELKLVHHRARRRGLQHGHALEPQAPRADRPVTLTATCGPEFGATRVACYYTIDGSEPSGSRGVARHGAVVAFSQRDTLWDSLTWGYLTRWQAQLPAQPAETVVRYRIGAWSHGGPELFADWPNATTTAEQAAAAFFRGEALPGGDPPGDPRGTTFAYHVGSPPAPAWAREAVIYQVFVDRFHPGEGRDWLQTDDLMGICGGTLWGVRDRLDYLADLGATCLWLSPTWVSPSHHGYDVTDYDRVEPRLGGEEALRAVIEGAHRRGLRVLLDLVCNHLSNHHPLFLEARRDPAGRYRGWFSFDDSELGYRAFFGAESMPELNLANPAARDWMIGVAQRWLRDYDVDGYRLDYANGPGPDFWSYFNVACKTTKPDSYCFGEIIDAPDEVRRYVGRLDGCLDFQLNDALRKTYAWQSWSEADYRTFLERHDAFFPEGFLKPAFLDNHDMDRFLFVANGDKDALLRAAASQFARPGPAIVYYGTEVGLSQAFSTREAGLHTSRTPMLWGDDQDRELLEAYRELIAARRA